jgi:hypothetical protein
MTENHDEELRRLNAEVDALEAELRRRKESTIPIERVKLLNQVLYAELAALESQITRWFVDAMATAITAEEREAVEKELPAKVDRAIARVNAAMEEQMRAWTIAGLEDRVKEDDLPW